MESEIAVNRLLDRLVGMGAVPEVRDEETGERNHGAIVMEVLEGLRPSVLRFAWMMEKRLRENDHKGGWHGALPQELLGRLQEEVQELDDAVDFVGDPARLGSLASLSSIVWDEASDVANFAMMAAEVRQGPAWLDKAGLGKAWHGKAGLGSVCFGGIAHVAIGTPNPRSKRNLEHYAQDLDKFDRDRRDHLEKHEAQGGVLDMGEETEEARDLWNRMSALLLREPKVTDHAWDAWLAAVSPRMARDGALVLVVPTPHNMTWLERNLDLGRSYRQAGGAAYMRLALAPPGGRRGSIIVSYYGEVPFPSLGRTTARSGVLPFCCPRLGTNGLRGRAVASVEWPPVEKGRSGARHRQQKEVRE